MVKRGFVVAGIMVTAVIGFVSYCNKDPAPTAPAKNGLIGVWAGAIGLRGGGGDTIDRKDTFGVVITIKETGFSLVRGNKIWGSSLFSRDSTRDAGTWAIAGDSITFSPDTAHDSCFQESAGLDWVQCKGYNEPPTYCDCLPPVHLKIDTAGNIWHAVMENSKHAGQFDTMNLIKQ